MDEITLKNYRCFADEQKARLAPLTLLVGENSTGKTSFLAMVRVLLDVAASRAVPDFKKDPYDLGSFDEISHHRGGRGGRADTFEAGFTSGPSHRLGIVEPDSSQKSYNFEVTFGRRGTTPIPLRTYESSGCNWLESHFLPGQPHVLRCGTARGEWEVELSNELSAVYERNPSLLPPLPYLLILRATEGPVSSFAQLRPLSGSPPFGPEDERELRPFAFGNHGLIRWTFASAPVRSKPRRTYDPSRPTQDPEGEYVPMYLANLSWSKGAWASLKRRLEQFGKTAGLFDEISIRSLGKASDPFQVQVRKFQGQRKGPLRNLVDVGYGVSQVLPVLTDLLRDDSPNQFLLQQPEVHLHPSAQAALGSLFCQVATEGRQLIVETHSDYILDRVRMDVRDGVCGLKPEDVSILFFERQGLGVQIHSIRLDEEGNVLDAPPAYGDFFINETTRSLGL